MISRVIQGWPSKKQGSAVINLPPGASASVHFGEQIERRIIVDMVQDADRGCDVERAYPMRANGADIVAEEARATAVAVPRGCDIGRAVIEAALVDVRQVAQDRGWSATNVEHALACLWPHGLAHEALQPGRRGGMLDELIDKSARESAACQPVVRSAMKASAYVEKRRRRLRFRRIRYCFSSLDEPRSLLACLGSTVRQIRK